MIRVTEISMPKEKECLGENNLPNFWQPNCGGLWKNTWESKKTSIS